MVLSDPHENDDQEGAADFENLEIVQKTASLDTSTNPYAPPPDFHSRDGTVLSWQGREIEVRGEALPSQMWLVIEYRFTIDRTETFSDTQITGSDTFEFEFNHQGRDVKATFKPMQWLPRGRNRFRMRIDGKEVAMETVAVRGFRIYSAVYFSIVVLLFVIAPTVFLATLSLLFSQP